MKAEDALRGVRRLLLDTNPVIYILERHPDFAQKAWTTVVAAKALNVQLVISPLTLIEVMSKPQMTSEELTLAMEFCLATEEIEHAPFTFDEGFALRVGFFRRSTSVKLPDCIQFACSERLECDAILTADQRFAKYSPRRVVSLSEIDV